MQNVPVDKIKKVLLEKSKEYSLILYAYSINSISKYYYYCISDVTVKEV